MLQLYEENKNSPFCETSNHLNKMLTLTQTKEKKPMEAIYKEKNVKKIAK